MPAALARITRGTPLRKAVTSDLLNALIDRYNAVDMLGAGGGVAAPPSIVRCANSTGGDLAAGASVSLTYAALTRERVPGLSAPLCSARDNDQTGVHAVLLDPIPDGMEGRAVVCGGAVATVSIASTTHQYARFAPGNIMQSCDLPQAEATILVPGGTGAVSAGMKLCLVHLWGLDDRAVADFRSETDFRVSFTSSGWSCSGGYVVWPGGGYQVPAITGSGTSCLYLSLGSSSGSIATASAMPSPSMSGATLVIPLAQISTILGRLALRQHRSGSVVLGGTPPQWVPGWSASGKHARIIEDGEEAYIPVEDCET